MNAPASLPSLRYCHQRTRSSLGCGSSRVATITRQPLLDAAGLLAGNKQDTPAALAQLLAGVAAGFREARQVDASVIEIHAADVGENGSE